MKSFLVILFMQEEDILGERNCDFNCKLLGNIEGNLQIKFEDYDGI